MDKKIIIKIESKYGNKLNYPISENGKLLAQLAGSKTLTLEHIKIIKELGYEIEVQTPTIE